MRRADVRPVFAVLVTTTLLALGCSNSVESFDQLHSRRLLVSGDLLFAGGTSDTWRLPVAGGSSSVAVDDQGPLAADATHLYVAGERKLWRVPLAGGAAEEFSPEINANVGLDDQNVYFTRRSSQAGGKRELVRQPKAGGDAVVLLDGLIDTQGLVVAGGFVYVATHDDFDAILKKVPVAGGAIEIVVRGSVEGLTADKTHVYIGKQDGLVRRMPVAGGQLERVATLQDGSGSYEIGALASDGTHLYVVGGSVTTTIGDPNAVAVQHTHLARVPVAGGAVEVLSDEFNEAPGGLALAKDKVFFGIGDTTYSVAK